MRLRHKNQDPTQRRKNCYKVKPDSRQLSVLCERYLELILADKWNTFLLLAQAPVIAGLVVLIWRDYDQVTESLLFVLALSAIWFGTLNACREIVKEKDIFEREWMKGLNLSAYLWSKVAVLSLLGLAQCICLVFVVNAYIDLGDPPLAHLLVLFPASLAGTGLGLLISASVTTVDRSPPSPYCCSHRFSFPNSCFPTNTPAISSNFWTSSPSPPGPTRDWPSLRVRKSIGRSSFGPLPYPVQ